MGRVLTVTRKRRSYNEEFKKQTVKYIQEQTKSIGDISAELNIPVGTLHQWMGKYRSFEDEPVASMDRIRELERQLKRKDRELANAKEELEIAKKALHIFSKPRN